MFRKLILAAALALGLTAGAQAQMVVSGAAVRLQVYTPGSAVGLWYTGAAGCTSGGLSLPGTATAEDRDRLWNVVTTAKIMKSNFTVWYSGCTLTSFGFDVNQ